MNHEKLTQYIFLIILVLISTFIGYQIGKSRWTDTLQSFYEEAVKVCIDVEPRFGELTFVESGNKGLYILCRRDLN